MCSVLVIFAEFPLPPLVRLSRNPHGGIDAIHDIACITHILTALYFQIPSTIVHRRPISFICAHNPHPPLDFPYETHHHRKYHTKLTIPTPSTDRTLICALQIKSKPAWASFRFGGLKRAPPVILSTQCAIASTMTPTQLYTLPLCGALYSVHCRSNPSPHSPVFGLMGQKPAPARFYQRNVPLHQL